MARTKFNAVDQSASLSASALSTTTATNTTAAQTFVSDTIVANETAGTTYSLEYFGSTYGASTLSVTLWIAINGTNVASVSFTLGATYTSGSPLMLRLQGLVTLAAAGTSVAVRADFIAWAGTTAYRATGSATVNQTSTWTVSAGATMGTAASGNGLVCNQAVIRRN